MKSSVSKNLVSFSAAATLFFYIYQMLAPEHRLYLPFSLPQLLVDVNGKALPKQPSISARSLTLQELVGHLTALTTNSFLWKHFYRSNIP